MGVIMRLFKISFLFVMLALAGCAQLGGPMYEGPSQHKPGATISGVSSRSHVFTWSSAKVEQIDGRRASLLRSSAFGYRVSPGQHKIGILVANNTGFIGSQNNALINVPLAAKNGENYTIKLRQQENKYSVWIINKAGQRVTQIISGKKLPVGTIQVEAPEALPVNS